MEKSPEIPIDRERVILELASQVKEKVMRNFQITGLGNEVESDKMMERVLTTVRDGVKASIRDLGDGDTTTFEKIQTILSGLVLSLDDQYSKLKTGDFGKEVEKEIANTKIILDFSKSEKIEKIDQFLSLITENAQKLINDDDTLKPKMLEELRHSLNKITTIIEQAIENDDEHDEKLGWAQLSGHSKNDSETLKTLLRIIKKSLQIDQE